jgi:hypothetical protein
MSYFINKNIAELKKALSFYSIGNSIQSIISLFQGKPYDDTSEALSFLGQRTPAKMHLMIEAQGKGNKAFHSTIRDIYKKSFPDAREDESFQKFDQVVKFICENKISAKFYIHPVHALMTDILRQKSLSTREENWKTELTRIVSNYQNRQCDIKIIDFSGYNSVTTESIANLSQSKTLNYYWDASHYKSEVGELILKRLFHEKHDDIPQDFGYELHQDTITSVLATIRKEQSQYTAYHSEEIQLAQTWSPKH